MSFSGAEASKKVSGVCQGSEKLFESFFKIITDKPSLTVRHTCRTDTKVGGSEPVNICGKFTDQRMKGTPGITGLFASRVHINKQV